jgi:deazaflavin-dependent oxidoreductase (nitroreductase family)
VALRLTVTLVGALFLGLLIILVVFLLGMRTKSPPVLNAVRRFNRAIVNPRQMKSAGEPGAYASVVRHRGRTSGRAYQTPVGAEATDDGFVIALVYGANADWLKNVLASGSATLVHDGHAYQVDQPEIIPMQAAVDHFAAKDQRSFRRFGVDQALRVRRVGPDTPPL